MKRVIYSFVLLGFILGSCQVDQLSDVQIDSKDISARIENGASSKTVMDENNNVCWTEDDQIVAFLKSTLGTKYQIKSSFVGESYGTFSKVSSSASSDDLYAGAELDHVVAYYPYDENVICEKSESGYALSVVLPEEQKYVAESFADGAFPMVAVSDDYEIVFKNVCGGIRFQFLGDKKISSIEITSNGGEKLSGNAVVKASYEGAPTIEMSSSAAASVVLNCGDGVQLNETDATDFIIALPPVKFADGFTAKITDTEGNKYELVSGKQNEVKRSSLLAMPPIDIRENVVSTRMLRLISTDYDSYQIEVTVPETVGPDGNIVRYTYGNEVTFNKVSANTTYDQMLLSNGGDRNTTDVDKVIEIEGTSDGDGNYLVPPIAPGEPTVFLAGEYTRDGQLVGEPEIIRFKTKEPSVLNVDFEVEVTEASAIDIDFVVTPGDGIDFYCMLVLDDVLYHSVMDEIGAAANLQWFVSSYYAMCSYGVLPLTGANHQSLSSLFNSVTPDTKYHVLLTGMGDSEGSTQCFKHVELKTESKKRTMAPVIEITPLQEESTPYSTVFNVRCTSFDDPASGPVVDCRLCYEYVHNWETALSSGYDLLSLISGNVPLSAEELKMINSSEGYDVEVSMIDGTSMRIGVAGYNDEYDVEPVVADYTSEFYTASPVTSEYLTTDVLEGEWTMTATGSDGNPLETTVTIIRGYEEGRDYPSGCSDELFLEQVEIFNQKRLAARNCLLLQGWFPATFEDYGCFDMRTPYDLLESQDYVAYDHQQLFFDAGPKMFIEVDAAGRLVVRTGEKYLPASDWQDTDAHYMGYCPGADSGLKFSYTDFPIAVSDDGKTMTISPVDGSYLNFIGYLNGEAVAPALVQSDIVLRKK